MCLCLSLTGFQSSLWQVISPAAERESEERIRELELEGNFRTICFTSVFADWEDKSGRRLGGEAKRVRVSPGTWVFFRAVSTRPCIFPCHWQKTAWWYPSICSINGQFSGCSILYVLYNNIVASSNFLHCTVSKQKNEKSLFPPFLFLCFVNFSREDLDWIYKNEGMFESLFFTLHNFCIWGKKKYSLFQSLQKKMDSSVPVGSLLFSSSQYPLRVNLEVQNIVGLPWLIGRVATCLCKWSHRNRSSQMAVSLSLCDSVSATTLSGVFPHGC